MKTLVKQVIINKIKIDFNIFIISWILNYNIFANMSSFQSYLIYFS